jgi:hypothetical protein
MKPIVRGRPDYCVSCGSRVVYDEISQSYVCPSCGLVYGFSETFSYEQVMHVAPASYTPKYDANVVKRAAELFGWSVAKEFKRMKKERARKVLEVLDMFRSREVNVEVGWDEIREAIRIIRQHKLDIDLEKVREIKVHKEISSLVNGNEKLTNDIWSFALLNKKTWSGYKASTVAKIFTYIYCKKNNININANIEKKYIKLADILMRHLKL